MPYSKTIFRVLLSSPSDLKPERKIVERIVSEINKIYKASPFGLELTLWEQDVPPETDLKHPQTRVDKIFKYDQSDLLIGMFYKKIGSPALESESGTVHEIDEAIKAFQVKGTPKVMLYFKVPTFKEPGLDMLDDYSRVLRKKSEYGKLGIFQDFKNIPEFEIYCREHLTKYVKQRIEEYQRDDILTDQSSSPYSVGIATLKTVTSLFANLENYLKNCNDTDKKLIYGFGIDMQVALPNLEYVLSYTKNTIFKILIIDPDSLKPNLDSYYDTTSFYHSIERLKRVREAICENGNEIIVKKSKLLYPFHGMMVGNDLYATLLRLSDGNVLYNQEPFVKVRKGATPVSDNLIVAFRSWFHYYWILAEEI